VYTIGAEGHLAAEGAVVVQAGRQFDEVGVRVARAAGHRPQGHHAVGFDIVRDLAHVLRVEQLDARLRYHQHAAQQRAQCQHPMNKNTTKLDNVHCKHVRK
jgi:hypothetical protein